MNDIPKENLENAVRVKDLYDPLDSLPDWVKHPKNYMKIQKALLETLTCGKSHSDPVKMAECPKCTENMKARRALMRKFGFKDSKVYMEWRRRQEEIKRRVPLEMYNRLVNEDKTSLEK